MGIPYNDQWVLHRMRPRRRRRAFDDKAVTGAAHPAHEVEGTGGGGAPAHEPRATHEPEATREAQATHEPGATVELQAAGDVSPEAAHESAAAGRKPAAPSSGRAFGKRPSWIDRDT